MRTEQLEYFVVTADLKSINKAAEQLYVVQSTISTALKKLEDEIGGPLLIKSYQGVELTELGQTVYCSAKNILKEVAGWQEAAKILQLNASTPTFNECRLSVTPESIKTFLFKVISDIQRSNPAINFTIKEGDFWQNMKDVSLGHSDCAITTIWEKAFMSSEVQKIIAENNLYVDILQKFNTVALVNKHSELAQKTKISLQELLAYPLVLYNTNTDPKWYQHLFDHYGKLHIGLISNSAKGCWLYINENPSAVILVNTLAAQAYLALENNPASLVLKTLKEDEPYLYIYVSAWENREKYQIIKNTIQQKTDDYLENKAAPF